MKQLGMVKSTSEAMRLIKQGAVKIAGEKVTDAQQRMPVSTQDILLQAGKRRIAKVIVRLIR
jgi:tyrosyl-tRNA synthetase